MSGGEGENLRELLREVPAEGEPRAFDEKAQVRESLRHVRRLLDEASAELDAVFAQLGLSRATGADPDDIAEGCIGEPATGDGEDEGETEARQERRGFRLIEQAEADAPGGANTEG